MNVKGATTMATMQIQARPEPVTIDPARTAVIVVDMQNAFGSREFEVPRREMCEEAG